MISVHELLAEVEKRQAENRSIDDLRDEILPYLRAYAHSNPLLSFAYYVESFGANAEAAKMYLRHLNLNPEHLETIARTVRDLKSK